MVQDYFAKFEGPPIDQSGIGNIWDIGIALLIHDRPNSTHQCHHGVIQQN